MGRDVVVINAQCLHNKPSKVQVEGLHAIIRSRAWVVSHRGGVKELAGACSQGRQTAWQFTELRSHSDVSVKLHSAAHAAQHWGNSHLCLLLCPGTFSHGVPQM